VAVQEVRPGRETGQEKQARSILRRCTRSTSLQRGKRQVAARELAEEAVLAAEEEEGEEEEEEGSSEVGPEVGIEMAAVGILLICFPTQRSVMLETAK